MAQSDEEICVLTFGVCLFCERAFVPLPALGGRAQHLLSAELLLPRALCSLIEACLYYVQRTFGVDLLLL